jgi:hypothetical protein
MRSIVNIISTIALLTLIFGVYSGKLIWILVGLAPLLIIPVQAFLKKRNVESIIHSQFNAEIEQLKRVGEKILVELDNCEIKDSSYTQDIIDERMTRFSHLNLDYGKVIGHEHVGQSLLIYRYAGTNGSETFIQSFAFGKETLKINILRDLVTLYVDRSDRSKYFFDLIPG